MFELNNGTVTWGGKEVSKLAASVLGDAAITLVQERERLRSNFHGVGRVRLSPSRDRPDDFRRSRSFALPAA